MNKYLNTLDTIHSVGLIAQMISQYRKSLVEYGIDKELANHMTLDMSKIVWENALKASNHYKTDGN